ncbi:hypothetical protein AGMMS50268_10280 [Spirochaetia bacterium]|nr:hypothetical protein AGMMS50268_10280 [Spirochaetia bacterium]
MALSIYHQRYTKNMKDREKKGYTLVIACAPAAENQQKAGRTPVSAVNAKIPGSAGVTVTGFCPSSLRVFPVVRG